MEAEISEDADQVASVMARDRMLSTPHRSAATILAHVMLHFPPHTPPLAAFLLPDSPQTAAAPERASRMGFSTIGFYAIDYLSEAIIALGYADDSISAFQ